MNKIKYLLVGSASIFLAACGAQNNISFNLTPGNCPDGTINAPYCMAIKIRNNEGGQNYINSTNYPINNLSISVLGANNLQYPTSSGSSLDPNGCLSATLGAGSSCTFYVKLSGESVPVGEYSTINVVANYTVKKQLFNSGGSSASSSITFYQIPSLIMTNNNGLAKNYGNNKTSNTYSVESGGNVSLTSTAIDSYYGFLWATTNANLFVSGNQAFTYNKTESTGIGAFSNILINGSTAYPVGSSYVYSASVYPIKNLNNWYQKSPTTIGVQNGVSAISGANVYLATNNRVYYCPTTSINPSCIAEAETTTGNINTLGVKSPVGNFTGLIVGTTEGLFAESGTTGSASNMFSSVLYNNLPISIPIKKITMDSIGNIYAIDGEFNIYKISANAANQAILLTTINASGNVAATVYDNAGQILYVATDQGAVYGCFNSASSYECSLDSNIIGFNGNMFGLNIATSLESSL